MFHVWFRNDRGSWLFFKTYNSYEEAELMCIKLEESGYNTDLRQDIDLGEITTQVLRTDVI